MTIAVTPTSLPPSTIGGAYSQLLTASGGSGGYTWALAWTFTLAFVGGSSTTCTVATNWAATMAVGDHFTDSSNPGVTFTITAIGAPFGGFVGLTFTPAASVIFQVSDVIASVGLTLPPGLTLGASTGLISGTVGASGIYQFRAVVTDSSFNQAVQPLSIGVFPAAPLDARVELDLAGTWTDISKFALQRDGSSPPITIARGRQSETSQINPSSVGMQWNNRDGRFTPRNPTGPYYGLLGRNTPVRVSVPYASTYLRLADDTASYISTPDSTALRLTTGIDVRVDVDPDDYTDPILAAKWGTTSATRSWILYMTQSGKAGFGWNDGSSEHFVFSTVPPPYGRLMLRAVLNCSAGTVTFFTAPSMGTGTQLGAVISVGTTTMAAGTGQAITVGNAPGFVAEFSTEPWRGVQGRVYEAQILNATPALVADPQFFAQAPGATSFADAQANTWTVAGSAALSNRSYRAHAECSSLPQAWDLSGTDVWTPVAAAGVLRRLQQNSTPVISTLRRYYTTLPAANALAAYWPVEDPVGATLIASGLPGGEPMGFRSVPGFQGTAGSLSADTNFPCSAQMPQVNTSTWFGSVSVPAAFTWTDNVTRFCLFEQAGSIPDTSVLMTVYTTGTVARVDLQYGVASNGSLNLTGYSTTGAQLFTTNYVTFGIDGIPQRISMDLVQAGANITCQIQTLQPGLSVGESFSVTLNTATVGAVTGVVLNPRAAAMGATVAGQITVQGKWDSLFDAAQPLNAWNGEAGGTRFARIATENGLNVRVYGFPAITAAMGFQPIDTLANLFQEIENADRGQLYEPAETLGIGYRTLNSLTNQAASVTFSYTGQQLGDGTQSLSPTYDDQYTVNDVTLSRNGGSSAQIQVTTGTMSIQPPPAGVGDYATSLTVYCEFDSQLPQIASWMAHVGSTDAERYPVIPLNLARSAIASLITAIQDTRIGGMFQITGPPGWLPPDVITQLLWGVTELLGGFFYMPDWNSVPESPYEVFQLNDAVHGRLDTDGSTLVSSVSSGATSLSVATTNAGTPPWTTAGGDFPFDIGIAGERITVTAISGASSPQTFTVTRSVNGVVKAQAAGAAVALFVPPILSLT